MKYITIFAETRLCPNCARQGQIFPNSSKRNQKLVEKVEYAQFGLRYNLLLNPIVKSIVAIPTITHD